MPVTPAHPLTEEEEEGVADANVAQRGFNLSAVKFNTAVTLHSLQY